MRILFVGERRSPTARRMGVRWEDGRLAAKQLFDAFEACGYDKENALFANVFERRGRHLIRDVNEDMSHPIVGMGRKAQRELDRMEVAYIPLVHPAARGTVRKKATYAKQVRAALRTAGVQCSS